MSSPAPSAFEEFLARRGLAALLVAVVTFVGYSGALGFDFLHDDFGQIVENPALQSWSYLPQYFAQHSWAGVYTTGGTYYRPFFLLWLRLNYLVFHLHPAGWHLVSVLIHVGVTLLVYRLVGKLLREREAAFIAALLFGLHPVHIEAVVWISAVSELLMTACVLGALLAWMRAQQAPRAWRGWATAAALYAAAMLFKETGIVFLAPAAALFFVRSAAEPEENRSASWAWGRWLALLPLPAAYLALRWLVLHGLGREGSSASGLQMALTWPAALLFYLWHLLFPFQLGYYYDFAYVSTATGAEFWWPCLALLAAMAAFLWLFRGSQRRMAVFALVLLLAPLAPVLYLGAFPADDLVHDRYLYLPSVGFVLLLALLYQRLRQVPRLARVGAAALGLLFFAALIAQQVTWANNLVFYSHGVETAPRNLVVMNNLGSEFARRGDPRRAELMFQRVLARDPNQWLANFNMGYLAYSQGRYQEAEPYFRTAVRLQPGDSESHMYLGITLLQLSQLEGAQQSLERALALRPDGYGYREALALVLAARGDRAAARRELQAELAMHPDNQRARKALENLRQP